MPVAWLPKTRRCTQRSPPGHPISKIEGPCALNASAPELIHLPSLGQLVLGDASSVHGGAFRRCCQASMNALFGDKAKRKSCRKSFIELHLNHEFRVG